jgi:hypothetical protein
LHLGGFLMQGHPAHASLSQMFTLSREDGEDTMSQQRQPQRYTAPTRYQIPTHLAVEDKIISYGGIGITVRQGFLLLVGWSTAFNVWQHLTMLTGSGMLGLLARIALTLIPGLISLVIAFLKIEDRTFESWLNMIVRYRALPKVYIWRPLPSNDAGASTTTSLSGSSFPYAGISEIALDATRR